MIHVSDFAYFVAIFYITVALQIIKLQSFEINDGVNPLQSTLTFWKVILSLDGNKIVNSI